MDEHKTVRGHSRMEYSELSLSHQPLLPSLSRTCHLRPATSTVELITASSLCHFTHVDMEA